MTVTFVSWIFLIVFVSFKFYKLDILNTLLQKKYHRSYLSQAETKCWSRGKKLRTFTWIIYLCMVLTSVG